MLFADKGVILKTQSVSVGIWILQNINLPRSKSNENTIISKYLEETKRKQFAIND